jgi:hypothetical protein
MANFNSALPLKSKGVSKFLMSLLWLRLGTNIISTIFALLEIIAKSIYELLAAIDGILAIASLFIILASVIILLVWLHRIHADLRDIFPEYKITPSGAVCRFLIPIYSLWGMNNALSTFANQFQEEGGDLTELSKQIRSLIAPLYSCVILSNVLGRITFSEITRNPENTILPVLYLVSGFADIGLTLVFIQLVKAMQTAVTQKAKRIFLSE